MKVPVPIIPTAAPLLNLALSYYIFTSLTSIYEYIMKIYYKITTESERGTYTCRFPLRAIRWLLKNAPSDFTLDGISVYALNCITFDPVGDVTTDEISIFLAELCRLWLDMQTAEYSGVTLTVSFGAPQQTRI